MTNYDRIKNMTVYDKSTKYYKYNLTKWSDNGKCHSFDL